MWVAAISCQFRRSPFSCPSTESGVDRGFLNPCPFTGSTIALRLGVDLGALLASDLGGPCGLGKSAFWASGPLSAGAAGRGQPAGGE